ncbi:MAG: hypothetical protein QM730_18775 [Anaerolineales bacterium]
MKRQTRDILLLLYCVLVAVFLLSACSDVNASTAPQRDAQTIFAVSNDFKKGAPTSFIDIHYSRTNIITIRGSGLENYPAYIGEISTGNIFPLYMESSIVTGSVPVMSDDGNYLAFQTEHKIYIALMSKVASDNYSISPESLISVFDQRSRCSLAWSPDSLQLASICLMLDGIKISLYKLGNDKPQDVFQYFEGSIDETEGVSWSPNETVLAFSLRYGYDDKKNKPSQKDIFLFHLDTHALLRLTNTPDDEQYPDWYPEGNILTFALTAKGDAESHDTRLIFSTEDGRCIKEVPNIKGIVSPSWSPDGSQIAYISDWTSIKIMETSKFIPQDFLTPQGLCKVEN